MSQASGFVLMGGRSSRIGTDKAFLKIGSKNFLENAVEKLRGFCEDVFVVLSRRQENQKHEIERLTNGVCVIFDVFQNRGALGGIHAALQACRREFAFILAVDLPLVETRLLFDLISCALKSKYDAVISTDKSQNIQPLCAVYRVYKCLPTIEKLLTETESASVRDFLARLEVEKVKADETSLFNVNTIEDYERLIAIWRNLKQ